MSSEPCSDDLLNIQDTAAPALLPPPPAITFPLPTGFVRVGDFTTSFKLWDKFETNYATGGSGPSLRWSCSTMAKLNMCVGFEFKIGPRHGIRGDDSIDIKFPRCSKPMGQRGVYLASLNWKSSGANSDAGVGSEWPHPIVTHQDFNLDDPNPVIGNIRDGNWHGFLAVCYNDSMGNVIIKEWYNPIASGYFADYVFMGSAKDTSGNIPFAPKLAFASTGNTGGTHPLQICIDEIPSNDADAGPYVFPSVNLDVRNMFTCEISQGATAAQVPYAAICPPGQYYDRIQNVCIQEPGSPGNTVNGIRMPSLPTTNYAYEDINYTWTPNHKLNGSFREEWDRMDFTTKGDLNSVIVGGYIKAAGSEDTTIQFKLGGGRHSDSDGGKAGRCYVITTALSGTTTALLKENPHPHLWLTPAEFTTYLGPRQGHYTGIICMKVNIIHFGNDCVRLITWIDTEGMNDAGTFTAAKQNWVRVLDIIDTGQMSEGEGQGAWLTGSVPGDSKVFIRTDNQNASGTYDFKFGFCARIRGGPAY